MKSGITGTDRKTIGDNLITRLREGPVDQVSTQKAKMVDKGFKVMLMPQALTGEVGLSGVKEIELDDIPHTIRKTKNNCYVATCREEHNEILARIFDRDEDISNVICDPIDPTKVFIIPKETMEKKVRRRNRALNILGLSTKVIQGAT